MSLLSLSHVHKSYGSTKALSDVSLEIEAGELHALVGSNGSGKSTLFKILAGVVPADRGEATMDGVGHDLSKPDPKFASQHGIRFVHQQPTVFEDLTVAENLTFAFDESQSLEILGRRKNRRRAADLLERFDVPADLDDHVGDLSAMTRTLVEIARALQDENRSRVIALDEPTAALPPNEAAHLLKRLRSYAEGGRAVLFVSHRLEEIVGVANRISVLRNGRLVASVRGNDVTHDELVELIVGRSIKKYLSKPADTESQNEVLRVEGLCGGPVKDVSFSVDSGEVLGIAGLAGSGRSSILRMLYGAQPRRSGSLWLEDGLVAPTDPAQALKLGIAALSEERARDGLFSTLSVSENLGAAAAGQYWRRGWIRHREERQAFEEAKETYSIKASSLEAPIGALSGGNQQKVILARLLRRQPRVLLLDEPTQGVDVGARTELWQLIARGVEAGAAAVVVSSDFQELLQICSRILILRDGCCTMDTQTTGLSPEEINLLLHQGGSN